MLLPTGRHGGGKFLSLKYLGRSTTVCAHAVSHLGVETLPKAESVLDLQGVLVKQGVDIDVDPYETARVNGEAFHKVLLEVYDLYSTWVDARDLESEVRERPTPTQLDPQAFLWDWSEAELWRRALTVLGDEQFSTACGDFDSPNGVRERLGLHEAAVAREAPRAQGKRETGSTHAEEDEDCWANLGNRDDRLCAPTERAHHQLGRTDRAACKG